MPFFLASLGRAGIMIFSESPPAKVRFVFGGGQTVEFGKGHLFSNWAADAGGIDPAHTKVTEIAIANYTEEMFASGVTEFTMSGTFPPGEPVYVYADFPQGMGTLSQGRQDAYSQASWKAEVTITADSEGNMVATGTVTYSIMDLYTWEKYPTIQKMGTPYWQKVEFEKPFSVNLGKLK